MSAETSAEQTETEMWKDEPMSMLLKIQDQLTSLRSLVELQEQMREVQGGLQSLRSAVAAQGNQLQQVQALMKASHVTSVDALAAPDSEPPMLPGEIVMEMSPKRPGGVKSRHVRSLALLHHKKSATIQSRSPGLGGDVKGERKERSSLGGIAALNKPRIMSMDQIEAHTAHVLLAPKALTLSRSAQSSKSRHEDEELEDFGEEPNDQPVRTFTSRQLTTNPNIVLQSCRRMSLDDLRTNHDAILAATTAQHTITRQSGFLVATDSRRSVLPRVANFWLTVLGIWDLEQVRSGCVLFAISFILLALSALVLYLSSAGLCDPYISATTLCYLVGVLAAAWRLRWSQIHGMLSREDGGLEDYARSSGFLDDWRSTSKRRFKEVLGFLFVMLCCRWLAYASDSFVDTGHPESPVTCGCFSVVALFFTAIVYIHLHIVAGMELAIDSFSINFYKEMDMELALGEWNTEWSSWFRRDAALSVRDDACCWSD
ncbi:unnamed protein product [Durusdinium trenchii]|uniref:Transmembrane protein n=1 Tax=Durusdinium trenchii TaxID=1381693 RepID=A0ABP0NWX7_9DINO